MTDNHTNAPPWKPRNPMEEAVERLKLNDFETAYSLLRELYPEGERYHPAIHSEVRDVRREWRAGLIQPRASRTLGAKLVWTVPNYGGLRPWFVCGDCEAKVTLLFKGRCRRCQGLRYQSQYDTRLDRLRAKSAELRRRRLGSFAELFDPVPSRPRRMRWDTYFKLVDELERIELEAARILAPDVPGFIDRVHERFEVARKFSHYERRGWGR